MKNIILDLWNEYWPRDFVNQLSQVVGGSVTTKERVGFVVTIDREFHHMIMRMIGHCFKGVWKKWFVNFGGL